MNMSSIQWYSMISRWRGERVSSFSEGLSELRGEFSVADRCVSRWENVFLCQWESDEEWRSVAEQIVDEIRILAVLKVGVVVGKDAEESIGMLESSEDGACVHLKENMFFGWERYRDGEGSDGKYSYRFFWGEKLKKSWG